jgi:RecA/RadA recombinase
MDRIPFGVGQLDSIIEGGAPPGSVVLLAGEVGAGAREFVYTSVAMNGLAQADAELFDLYYGGLHGDAVVPEDIHFIFRTYHPGIGTETMAECIRRLGDEVEPAL